MRLIQIVSILVILALILGCQKKEEVEQEAAVTTEQEMISVADVVTFNYVCLPFVGSYENHEKVIGDFMQAVEAQEIDFSAPMLGIYYNSPMDTPAESLSWEIGFEVAEMIEVSKPLVMKTWNFTKVVKTIHIGPFETVGETYPKIFEFIGKQNMMPAGPTMERFLSKPEEVKPEEFQTEIWVPVTSPPMEE